MDFSDYLRVLRRNWILLVSVTLAGLLFAAAVSIFVKPTYKSDTQLFVAIQNSGSVSELQQGNTFSQARVQSYVKTVRTPVVLQPAIQNLGLDVTADQLAEKVTATTDLNTVLINISVEDNSPVQAAAIAQAIANSLVTAVDTLERPKAGESSPVSLSIIRPATAPPSPASPNMRLNLSIGLLLGLLVGVTAAVLRTTIDSRIRGEEDIRSLTDVPVLGGIAFDQQANTRPLLTQARHQSPRAESFRQLRTNLSFANVSGPAPTVLVTSSLPGEGKTTTAINLSIALAQTGQRVCLIDADLRRPMIDDYLGLERSAGLTTALVGQSDVFDLLQPWGADELFILTSGQIPPNPSELLGSREMQSLLRRLEGSFDTVVVDAPPLLPVTDAAVLAQHVGGALVVVGSQRVRQQHLKRALGSLELVGANVMGLVLNRLPSKGPDAYSYTYYSYESKGGSSVKDHEHSNNQGPDSPPVEGVHTSPSDADDTRDGFASRLARRRAAENSR
ncbi:polysaccharide biosynthesis tyrosine autokinase [Arthrobacter sp. AK04]|uniref:polysaccharide biosynthesis tyrosine autokinase n=1 Tax=Arthrobacter sp. AK04 TaxID=2900048 RepID=UPI001E309444|nr:polysaccharide biosynthesis tyrosine autokinase [Arthrobacter sp. AK04]MCD5343527.1 polysaccharide biosynthesis tyrosine autokinase [Arthrobacter sp. AK04]